MGHIPSFSDSVHFLKSCFYLCLFAYIGVNYVLTMSNMADVL